MRGVLPCDIEAWDIVEGKKRVYEAPLLSKLNYYYYGGSSMINPPPKLPTQE